MLTLDQIQTRLRKPGTRLEDVAARSGLSYSTVRRYQRGEVVEPPLSVVVALSDALGEGAEDDR